MLSHFWVFETPWTVAYQAPPSMGFSRQEYWSGLPFPSPGDLPNPGIEPGFPRIGGRRFNLWATRETASTNQGSKWKERSEFTIALSKWISPAQGKAPSSGSQQLGSRRGQCTRVPVGAPSTTCIHAGRGPRCASGCVPFYNLQSSLLSKEFKEFAH